jgi:hypothetical protein
MKRQAVSLASPVKYLEDLHMATAATALGCTTRPPGRRPLAGKKYLTCRARGST